MQTFLPYDDFQASARCLDPSRLCGQRNEAAILIRAVTEGNGWSKHPAARMWNGYSDALKAYYNAILAEFEARGGHNIKLQPAVIDTQFCMPPWFGDEKLHSSHRAALLAKNPEWYSKFGWTEEPVINYLWPGTDN